MVLVNDTERCVFYFLSNDISDKLLWNTSAEPVDVMKDKAETAAKKRSDEQWQGHFKVIEFDTNRTSINVI